MVNLNEITGTVVFSPNGNYIVGASDKQNAEFRQKCQNVQSMIDMDVLQEKIRNRDSVEIKGITPIALASENYNDIRKVTEMPQSIFGDAFGYQMQKDISDYMRQYYTGEISDDDVKNFFNECCSSMRAYHSQMRHTTGMNEEDNMQIISEIYEMFAKENQRAARNANYEEGREINSQYGAAADIAEEWELPAIDTDEIERNSKYTLDGGFDFNSGWNFTNRNQVGRSSMTGETAAPPEGFKFFYKENGGAESRGIVRFWAGAKSWKTDVPFYISRDSLKGQIFNLSDYAKVSESDTGNYRAYNEFFRNFSIFTRWYSYESGINNRFGNYVPAYE